MSYYLYDFEDEFNFDKLIIGDKIKLENNNYRYYIYYLDKIPMDFYIKLPSIKLIYSYKYNKYNQIKIPLYPIYDKVIKLINFLKQMKKKIKEINNTEKKFLDSIEKKENLKLLKINIHNDFKVTHKNEKIDIKELKVTSEIYGIINIPYVWENENSYGLSLNATKIIYIPKIEDDNVDFIDISDNESSVKSEIVQTQKQEIIINSNNNKEIKKSVFNISPDLLLEMKNKLNRIL
jgi:hypothetical protein